MRRLAALALLLAAPAAAAPADRPLILSDGRTLNLWCDGRRGPVVLLESGWAADSRAWRRVIAGLSGTFRVCAQDRAGEGRSSPGPLPRDSTAVAHDLKAALERGGVPGPYLLVGHSIGALNMRRLARLYPEAVAGMVLVDPSMPGMGVPPQAARARACVAALQAAPADTGSQAPAPAGPEGQAAAPAADAALLARCRGRDPDAALARWMSRQSELESLPEAADLEAQPAGSLGFPLIVLTAGRSFPDPAMAAAWHARHAALAALSATGTAQLVEDSGHMMMFDRPDAVVQAVERIAAAVAAGAAAPARSPREGD